MNDDLKPSAHRPSAIGAEQAFIMSGAEQAFIMSELICLRYRDHKDGGRIAQDIANEIAEVARAWRRQHLEPQADR